MEQPAGRGRSEVVAPMPERDLDTGGDRLRRLALRVVVRGALEDLVPAGPAVLRQDGAVRVAERRLPACVGDADAVPRSGIAELRVESAGQLARWPRARVDDRASGRSGRRRRRGGRAPRSRSARAACADRRARRPSRRPRSTPGSERTKSIVSAIVSSVSPGRPKMSPRSAETLVLGEQRDERVQMASPEGLLRGLEQRVGRAVDRDRDVAVRLAHELGELGRERSRVEVRAPGDVLARARGRGALRAPRSGAARRGG